MGENKKKCCLQEKAIDLLIILEGLNSELDDFLTNHDLSLRLDQGYIRLVFQKRAEEISKIYIPKAMMVMKSWKNGLLDEEAFVELCSFFTNSEKLVETWNSIEKIELSNIENIQQEIKRLCDIR